MTGDDHGTQRQRRPQREHEAAVARPAAGEPRPEARALDRADRRGGGRDRRPRGPRRPVDAQGRGRARRRDDVAVSLRARQGRAARPHARPRLRARRRSSSAIAARTGARCSRSSPAGPGSSTSTIPGCCRSTRRGRSSAPTRSPASTSRSPPSTGSGSTDREQVAMLIAIESYVTGTARTYVLQQQASRGVAASATRSSGPRRSRRCARRWPAATTPRSRGSARTRSRWRGEEALEFGLGPLLDGFAGARRRQARRGRLTPRRPRDAPSAGQSPSSTASGGPVSSWP